MMMLNWIKVQLLRYRGWKIGNNVRIGKNCVIDAESVEIGDDCYIGDNCVIKAQKISIGNNCLIFPGLNCTVNTEFSIGSRCKISRNVTICANSVKVGIELWCNENTEIGGGGCKKKTANIKIGDFVHIGKGVSINVCKPVTIGSFTGIGIESMIFTHSSGNGQSILDGYKHIEKAVTIGNHVSVFTRAIISPGSQIADGVTLGAMSFFSGTSIEKGLYAGIPAVYKKRTLPVPDLQRVEKLYSALSSECSDLFQVVPDYSELNQKVIIVAELHDDNADIIQNNGGTVVIALKNNCTVDHEISIFDIEKHEVSGTACPLSEKTRDALRRNGILFSYNGYAPPLLSYKYFIQEGIERI